MDAFLFPGQGSQYVGMGQDLFPKYSDLVTKADEILGYSIASLCASDTNNNLNDTRFTQPALYVVNVLSYLNKLEHTSSEPDALAGHSLGEYSALFAAGVVDFETGLRLVKRRAELMAQNSVGSMAAVVGIVESDIRKILASSNFEELDIASINTSRQVVISGAHDLLAQLGKLLESQNIKYYPLKVSAAFHSRHMKSASSKYASFLEQFTFKPPKIPVISNVFALPYSVEQTPRLLTDQIFSPVLWKKTVQYMMAMGIQSFEEIGPGHALSNMLKDIDADPDLVLDTKTSSPEPIGGFSNHSEKFHAFSESEQDVQSVKLWNKKNDIGTLVSIDDSSRNYKTSTKAMLLFGAKPVIYLQDIRGYIPLNQVEKV